VICLTMETQLPIMRHTAIVISLALFGTIVLGIGIGGADLCANRGPVI